MDQRGLRPGRPPPRLPRRRVGQEWVADRFREIGLEDVRLEPVDVTRWEPLDWSLEVVAGGDDTHPRLLPVPYAAPVDGLAVELAAYDPGQPDLVAGKASLYDVPLIRIPADLLASSGSAPERPVGPHHRPRRHASRAPSTSCRSARTSRTYWSRRSRPAPPSSSGRSPTTPATPTSTSSPTTASAGRSPVCGSAAPTGRGSVSAGRGTGTGPAHGRGNDRASTSRTTWWASCRGPTTRWSSSAPTTMGRGRRPSRTAAASPWCWRRRRTGRRNRSSERPHRLVFLLQGGHMSGGAGLHAYVDAHRDELDSWCSRSTSSTPPCEFAEADGELGARPACPCPAGASPAASPSSRRPSPMRSRPRSWGAR